MNSFDTLVKGKPECFGHRGATSPDAHCPACTHNKLCLSAVWAVLNAVRNEKLPANDYLPIELLDFTEIHYMRCQSLGVSDLQCSHIAKQFTFEVVEKLHDRVLPPRSPEEIESAREWEEFFSDIDTNNASKSRAAAELVEAIAAPPTKAAHSATGTISAPTRTTPDTVKSEPIASTSKGYKFPMPEGRPHESQTNDQLTARLKQLINQAFHYSPGSGYAAIRAEFCAIQIEMNLRQQHAPRFRPMHRMQKEVFTDEERAESLDRQVIDLHWRAHSIMKPATQANKYSTIFDSAPFDLPAAERLAQEKWSPEAKAIHLHLSEDMQWENAIIQITNIRKRWFTIEHGEIRKGHEIKQAGAPQIAKTLHEAVTRENKRQVLASIPGMVEAWKARRIVGDNPAQIARMIALMTGRKPRNRKAVMRTLKSLDRYLGAKPFRSE